MAGQPNINFELAFELTGHTQSINCVVISKDGTRLFSGGKSFQIQNELLKNLNSFIGDDAALFVWDMKDGTQLQRISQPFFGAVTSLALIDYASDSAKMVVVGSGDGSVATYTESSSVSHILVDGQKIVLT